MSTMYFGPTGLIQFKSERDIIYTMGNVTGTTTKTIDVKPAPTNASTNPPQLLAGQELRYRGPPSENKRPNDMGAVLVSLASKRQRVTVVWPTVTTHAQMGENDAIRDSTEMYERFMKFVRNGVVLRPQPLAGLDPTAEVILMYKIVRVKICGMISNRVAAVLTLAVKPRDTKISYSQAYVEQQPNDLRDATKYCVQACDVVAARFLGDIESVKIAVDMLNDDQIEFISNFSDGGIEFKYPLGCLVVEPNAFQMGKHCLQGIHAFRDPASAKEYWRTGFIDDVASPVITCSYYADAIDKIPGGTALTNVGATIVPTDPKKIRQQQIKNVSMTVYNHNFDADGHLVELEDTVPFASSWDSAAPPLPQFTNPSGY